MHHVQSDHWNWAVAQNEREKASFLPENFAPLEANGLLNRVDGNQEIFPGVFVERVDGHTEAQQIVRISAGGETLVFVADLIPTSAHLPRVWGMAYDIRPMVTIQEKAAFLDRAIEGGWRLFFEHDAYTESGLVIRGERGPELSHTGQIAEL
jgi:hypothetical protein